MKAHRVSGHISWQDAHGWFHAFIVPPTDVMAIDAQGAITDAATLLFLCFPEDTRQATFYAEVACADTITFGRASWEA